MATLKSDLPQGTLDLLILKTLAVDPLHGYAIAQRLEQVSRGVVQVPEGSLYPALHRLENRGLLSADWKETETGREAKFYRLTRKGRKQLEAEAASWWGRRPVIHGRTVCLPRARPFAPTLSALPWSDCSAAKAVSSESAAWTCWTARPFSTSNPI